MTSTATPPRTADGSTLQDVGAWVTEHLPALLAEHGVPAAAVAVGLGDDVVDAAAGVLHLGTGVEADTDSVFQIGSVTKVWTATLVLQLVDEGLLDLDATVRTYLPDVRVADESASATMTVRQLLCHTAGFEGDVFTDTGRGDDCVEKLVATLDDVPQLFPPGELFSYNNAGYCVLGRIVEVLRGASYDACLAEYLIGPLGLTHAAPSPYEAIMYRAAMGHVQRDPDAEQEPAPFWALTRSNGPAGAMLAMTARDLVAFARMHLSDGAAADGTQVLTPESVVAMRTHEVTLPDLRVLGTGWGLGWELFENVGVPMVGHDGNTVGQASFLRVVPELGLSVALLTNGGDPYGLFHDVVGHVLRELAGIELAGHPEPRPTPSPSATSRATRHLRQPGDAGRREPGRRRPGVVRDLAEGCLARPGQPGAALGAGPSRPGRPHPAGADLRAPHPARLRGQRRRGAGRVGPPRPGRAPRGLTPHAPRTRVRGTPTPTAGRRRRPGNQEEGAP